jgi:tripartite-type tricarboxylate transporter receptor subunit TctC
MVSAANDFNVEEQDVGWKICIIALALSNLSAATQAFAQESAYPNRPVKIVVPFPAGGPIDLLARTLGNRLSEAWNQPVVIENRAGGNSAVGALAVARAEPDGYTLLMGMDTTLVYNPLTVSNLSYNASEFVPVSMAANNTPLIIVPANGPKSTQDLIAQAKEAPGKLNYGAAVLPLRLAGFVFHKMAGITSTEIVYRGSAENVQGLLTGSVQYTFDGLSASLGLIREGKLRPLARMGARPLSPLPDLPHVSQQIDMKDFNSVTTWSGIVAPPGTPPAIVASAQKAIVAALSAPEVVNRLDGVGISVQTSTPEQFRDFIRSESARWGQVVKDAGLKIQ